MSSTLRLKDIAHDVSRDNPGLKVAKETLETLLASAFKVIVERTASGERVHIMNFGSFKTSTYKGRSITSPMLGGQTVEFGDRQVLRFHMAPNAKEMIAKIVGSSEEPAPKPKKKAKQESAPEPAPAKKAAASAKKKSKKKKQRAAEE